MESMDTAASAMAKMPPEAAFGRPENPPPSQYAPRIEATITSTGAEVDFMLTARPAITFVPWPVRLAWAMCCTGGYSFAVKYSVIQTIRPVRARPMREMKNTVFAVNTPALAPRPSMKLLDTK